MRRRRGSSFRRSSGLTFCFFAQRTQGKKTGYGPFSAFFAFFCVLQWKDRRKVEKNGKFLLTKKQERSILSYIAVISR